MGWSKDTVVGVQGTNWTGGGMQRMTEHKVEGPWMPDDFGKQSCHPSSGLWVMD